MNFAKIWMSLFGTTTFLNLDMGFWVSMAISLLIALLMNVIAWSTKPYKKDEEERD